ATDKVKAIVEPSLEAMGYEVVRVQLTGGGGNAVLQIMADRTDGGEMQVDDCADISRAISAVLDVDDPISGAYSLEVSSPGIDRPLTKLDHFARFAGHDARIELREGLEGRKRFRGILSGIEGELVLLRLADDECDEQTIELPFEQISKAKLVLTDELLAAHGMPVE
ncbi:MAG: ribosome maturation factor RimP, partial [Pseudomonadota bacterium]